ncbi:CD109 antigen-like [Hyperolius riggenbachi]|uniref:CD109 antigen-like n=1 Tax=Hyperolius riggenbachi TaxID=752182 RepID=UPI0035A384CB
MRVDQQPLSTEEKGSNISLKITQFSNYWWWYSSINSVVQRYTKPLDDFLAIKFEVLPTTQMMTMEAEYRNTTQTWYLYKSYGMNYIEISDISSPVQVGTPFQVQTEVYPEVEELFYVVMAKGVVVSAGKQKRTAFSLTPEQSWAPCANIILFCHAVDSYVNILQISSVLHVKGMFKNKVSLSWSKSKAQPSEQVSLLINVNESNSLVGLQVTDKQASFRRDDKDFTASKVEKSFMSYTQPWDFYTVTDAATSMYYFSAEDVDPTPSGIPGLNPTASSIQGSPTNVEAQFAEPWIWLDTNLSSRNTFSLPLSVLDTMTSWLANAFVISDKHGLGFTEEPVEFQVFQNVSITVNLPYSVIRGELFLLEVVLCNHLRENLKVKVSLEKNMLFDMGELNNGSAEAQQTLDVPSKEEKLFLFPVKPKKVGTIPITVKAVSNTTSNTVTRNIVVKAEGLRKTYSQSTLFDLTTLGPNLPLSKTLSFTFPPDVVEGSEEAYINIIGNLLVPSLDGLESLIEMPCGCGEQNMIYLAPDIYVMQYLEATNQVTENIRKSAVEKMRQGYQNELIYRRNDSSFSAFGMYDTSGSTWLSAFVLRCFLQARPYIYINPDVLNQTVNWLLQYQDIRTGIFSEPGRVIHYSLQGGLNGPITLTAYILTSLLEDVHYARLYESRIHKAVQYLEEQFQKGIASNYTLSVVAYALLLANSTKGAAALDQLNSRATVSGSSKYWSAPLEKVAYYWQPMTADIETAAYALLSFHHQSRVADGIPVMKWLSQQRNHLGGFISTQDTVMALQALSKFSLLTHSNETSLTMSVTGPGTSKPKVFEINSENIMLLQSTEIEVSQPLSVNVTAVGRGLAIAQLNILYNLKTSSRHRSAAASEAFSLDVKVEEDKVYTDRLSTEICTSYLGKWNQTGMVILEVGYVSGFVMSLEGIPINGSVKKVETNTEKIFIYLDSVTANQTCLHIPMERDFKVASSKDALIRIYDYYNPSDFASRTYNTVPKDICELCGTNCDFCTVSKTLEAYNSAASPAYSLFWCCIALLIYIFPYISFPF